ncbi:MAG TPA: hypothetical protein DEA40_15135 [Parvularcula sp.]|nr:hypothetical protein [Parvularcula sp.]HBS35711.1 hypothetical protein [Parvularcula sp.]
MNGLGAIRGPRALALALAFVCAAIAIVGLWAVIVRPLSDRAAKIASLRSEITTLEKQKARLGDPGRWTSARETALATRSEFLTKEGGSPAFAQIQLAMSGAASEAGVSVISAQAFTPSEGEASAAGVRMSVVGDFNAAVEFLAALSAAQPKLIISELTIRRQSGEGQEAEYGLTVAAVALFWTESGA